MKLFSNVAEGFRLPTTVVWLIVLVACLCSHDGVDHGQYLKWAKAAALGDIDHLENQAGLTASTGLPFSPWSPGSGFLIAPVYWVLSLLGLQNGAGLITGYICLTIFWFSFFAGLKNLVGSQWAMVGCLLAAAGTPLAYYSSAISSETYSLAPAGYLFWQLTQFWRGRSVSVWGVGAATGILIMIRSYLAIYAWPILAFFFIQAFLPWRLFSSGNEHDELRRQPIAKRETGLVLILIAIAMVPVLVSNHWMTGAWFRSPYQFGDELFKSFDLTAPHFYNVLFDPFHGLIPSHPLVLIGFGCLVAQIFISGSRREWSLFVGWTLFAAVILINTYFQSCWYYWWMAMSSFGMRGLVLVHIPTMAALLVTLAGLRRTLESQALIVSQKRAIQILEIFVWSSVGFSVLWGWLHWCCGPTNATTMIGLAQILFTEFCSWCSLESMVALVAAVLIGTFLRRLQDGGKRSNGLSAVVLALTILVLAKPMRQILEEGISPAFFLIVCSAIGIGMIATYYRVGAFRKMARPAMLTAWSLMLIFFAWLAIWTTPRIAGAPAVSMAPDELVFNLPDTRRAYLTLLQIPRLESKREELYRFFARTQPESWVRDQLPKGPGQLTGLPKRLTVQRQ